MSKFLEENVFVKDSGIHGKGIFTSVEIKRGRKIMIITGEIIDEKECIRREEEENNVYIFWNDTNYIDVNNTEKIKYINHNCKSNCYIDAYSDYALVLAAKRNIKPGDELTIDYGYEEIYQECTCKKCI